MPLSYSSWPGSSIKNSKNSRADSSKGLTYIGSLSNCSLVVAPTTLGRRRFDRLRPPRRSVSFSVFDRNVSGWSVKILLTASRSFARSSRHVNQ